MGELLSATFGIESPVATVAAALAVIVLLGLVLLFLRQTFAGRPRRASGQGPRLAVVDHVAVDDRRRLVLVRRDRIEHLLMIGGPSDIVIEAGIGASAATAQPAKAAGEPARPAGPARIEPVPRPARQEPAGGAKA
ncbi:flagellar biosynthetic protein FliO, partial [Propylenella binzhouense]